MNQSDIDALHRARSTDPPTSHEAAATVEELREKQKAVLWQLQAAGWTGLTDEELLGRYENLVEIQPRLTLRQSPSGLRTRRSELGELGLVADAGATRRTRSGRRAIVWVIP